MTCSACISGQSFCDRPNCQECGPARLLVMSTQVQPPRHCDDTQKPCETKNQHPGFKLPGFSHPRHRPGSPGSNLPRQPTQQPGPSTIPLLPLQQPTPPVSIPLQPLPPTPQQQPVMQSIPLQPLPPAPQPSPTILAPTPVSHPVSAVPITLSPAPVTPPTPMTVSLTHATAGVRASGQASRYVGMSPEAIFLRWQYSPIRADFYAMSEREQYMLVLRYLQEIATIGQAANALFGTMQPPPFKTGMQLTEATRQYVRLMNTPNASLVGERQGAEQLLAYFRARGLAQSLADIAPISVADKVKALAELNPRANDSELARAVGGIDRYLDLAVASGAGASAPAPAPSGQAYGIPRTLAPSGQTYGNPAPSSSNAGKSPTGTPDLSTTALNDAAAALGAIAGTVSTIIQSGNQRQLAELQSQAQVEIARIQANAASTQNAQQQADMARQIAALTQLITASQAAQQRVESSRQQEVVAPPPQPSRTGLYIGLAVGGVAIVGGGIALYVINKKKARRNPDPWALAPYESGY